MNDEAVYNYLKRRKTTMWGSRTGLDKLDLDIARSMAPSLAAGYVYDVTELGKLAVSLAKEDVNPSVYEFVNVASSGFQSHLTNPARKWFALGNGLGGVVEDEGKDLETRGWLDDATAMIEKVLSISGTYNALHEGYRQLVLFGRCCILRTEDLHTVVRHTCLIPGTYAFGFNEAGEVNAVLRKFALTPADCVELYGREVCKDELLKRADENDATIKETIWQLIEPHRDSIGHVLGVPAMKGLALSDEHLYRSIHFAEGNFKKHVLRVRGFKRSPILAPRYESSGGNLYGEGLGKRLLPACRGLQTATRMKYEALAQCVRPPVNAPAEMKEARITLSPGGVNYVTSMGTGQSMGVSSVYTSRPDLNAIALEVQSMENKLARGFLNHLFMTLDQIRERTKTATEANELLIEARQILGPVITAWDKELLNPLVMGVFHACVDVGLIEVPDGVAMSGVQPQYLSLIHMAQRATGLNNMQTFLTLVSGVAQMKPEVLDKVSGDGTIEQMAGMLQIPERMLASREEVQSVREQRAQMQAQQAQMEQQAAGLQMAQMEAGIAKDMARLPTGNDAANLMLGSAM